MGKHSFDIVRNTFSEMNLPRFPAGINPWLEAKAMLWYLPPPLLRELRCLRDNRGTGNVASQFREGRKRGQTGLAYCCSSCSCGQLPHCAHCSLNPWQAKHKQGGPMKTQGAAGSSDAFLLSWLAQQPQRNRNIAKMYRHITSRYHCSVALVQQQPGLSQWSPHRRAVHSNPWPGGHLVTHVHSAVNGLSCCTAIIYKTWAERAWPRHLGWFALALRWVVLCQWLLPSLVQAALVSWDVTCGKNVQFLLLLFCFWPQLAEC